jgi:hypothetical protein
MCFLQLYLSFVVALAVILTYVRNTTPISFLNSFNFSLQLGWYHIVERPFKDQYDFISTINGIGQESLNDLFPLIDRHNIEHTALPGQTAGKAREGRSDSIPTG